MHIQIRYSEVVLRDAYIGFWVLGFLWEVSRWDWAVSLSHFALVPLQQITVTISSIIPGLEETTFLWSKAGHCHALENVLKTSHFSYTRSRLFVPRNSASSMRPVSFNKLKSVTFQVKWSGLYCHTMIMQVYTDMKICSPGPQGNILQQ